MTKLALLAATALTMPRAFSNDVPFAQTCETVIVTGANGDPVRMNKSDYDADQAEGGAKALKLHKSDDGPQTVAGTETVLPDNVTIPPAPSSGVPLAEATPPQTPSPGQYLVQQNGRKFYIVQADGAGGFPKVTGVDGIDEKGYASDQEAWAAIVAVQTAGGAPAPVVPAAQ